MADDRKSSAEDWRDERSLLSISWCFRVHLKQGFEFSEELDTSRCCLSFDL